MELLSDLFIFDITWVKWADKRKIKIFKSKGLAIMAPFTGLLFLPRIDRMDLLLPHSVIFEGLEMKTWGDVVFDLNKQ